ncbi:TIGR01244 family sulfur transferase [Marinobacter salicampi]|uniref:TIGR01244 family sulfur transferase n=1 Tax=Marinobacter salicampi TaxID=435907 RepID=UPI00140BED60|nr:TIGR01244 family sulfur transferase [Marinobacter salicampi]
MDIRKLDERLSVTAQPSLEEIDQLADKGFRTIISNRPRGETEDQPDMQALQERAEALEMVWREIPVKPGEYSDQDVENFTQVLKSVPTPAVGFCRTGKRVAHLWALSEAPRCPIPELMEAAHAAGFGLEPLKEELEHHARKR